MKWYIVLAGVELDGSIRIMATKLLAMNDDDACVTHSENFPDARIINVTQIDQFNEIG